MAALGLPSDAEHVRSTAWLDLVASTVDLVACVLAILIVRELTSRQRERARALAVATA